MFSPVHGEYLESGNVEDADEGRTLSLGAIKGPVNPHYDPFEQPLVQRFTDRFHSVFALNANKSIMHFHKTHTWRK